MTRTSFAQGVIALSTRAYSASDKPRGTSMKPRAWIGEVIAGTEEMRSYGSMAEGTGSDKSDFTVRC